MSEYLKQQFKKAFDFDWKLGGKIPDSSFNVITLKGLIDFGKDGPDVSSMKERVDATGFKCAASGQYFRMLTRIAGETDWTFAILVCRVPHLTHFRQFGSDVVPQAYVHDELVKSLQTWTNGSVPRELNQWYSQQRNGPVIPFGSKHLVQEYTFFLYALGDRSTGGTRVLRPFVGYISVGNFLSGCMCGYVSHPRLGIRCSVSLTRTQVSRAQPLCLIEDRHKELSSTTKARK